MIPLAFLEGGFHIGYKTKGDDESSMENTWVVKKYRETLKETFQKMAETFKSQTQEAVK